MPPDDPNPRDEALVPKAEPLPAEFDPFQLLSDTDLANVPEATIARSNRQIQALVVLGPAGGSVITCPGQQEGVSEFKRCPFFHQCELRRAGAAPQGQPCPIERNLVAVNFTKWAEHIGANAITLRADERSFVSDMTWIELQKSRCLAVLSHAEQSRMAHRNIKEVHPETGEPMSWEWVVHVNEDLLDRLTTQTRMLFRDWELTPEMKTKKARLEGKGKGNDLGTRLAAKADKLRRLGTGEPTPTA